MKSLLTKLKARAHNSRELNNYNNRNSFTTDTKSFKLIHRVNSPFKLTIKDALIIIWSLKVRNSIRIVNTEPVLIPFHRFFTLNRLWSHNISLNYLPANQISKSNNNQLSRTPNPNNTLLINFQPTTNLANITNPILSITPNP